MEAVHVFFFFTEKRIVQFKCLVCSDLPFVVAVTFFFFFFERLESILFQGPQMKTRICLVVVVDILCSCIHECNRKTVYNVQNQ